MKQTKTPVQANDDDFITDETVSKLNNNLMAV